MNPEPLDTDEKLEAALGELTEWRGGETHLWKRALERESNVRRARGVIASISGWSPSRKILAAAAGLAIVCAVGFSVQTALQRNDPLKRNAVDSAVSSLRNFREAHATYGDAWDGRAWTTTPDDISPSAEMNDAVEHSRATGGNGGPFLSGGGGGGGFVPGRRHQDSTSEDASFTADRAVVRKATMHLVSKDVRAAYLKAMHIVSPVYGEFVESSAMQGSGEIAEANITLRVAANRLDDVLNDLRDLAIVVSEDKTGDDVTSQLIDLEARLRNEERVERELLELVETRADAPLDDLLQLREEIGKVRGSVERYRAQIAQMNKLVSLATVLIIIRYDFDDEEDEAADEDGEGTLGAYFAENIAAAWEGGMRFLADTLGVIVQIIVGGFIWWVIAAILIVVAMRMKGRKIETAI